MTELQSSLLHVVPVPSSRSTAESGNSGLKRLPLTELMALRHGWVSPAADYDQGRGPLTACQHRGFASPDVDVDHHAVGIQIVLLVPSEHSGQSLYRLDGVSNLKTPSHPGFGLGDRDLFEIGATEGKFRRIDPAVFVQVSRQVRSRDLAEDLKRLLASPRQPPSSPHGAPERVLRHAAPRTTPRPSGSP